MPVQADIPVAIATEEVQRALSHGRRGPDWMNPEIARAVETARPLFHPRVAFRWAAVREVREETAVLRFDDDGRETRLRIGPNFHLLGDGRRALAFVSTIGQALDDAVQSRNRAGDLLGGYLLDCVGVVALAKVSEAANRIAEAEAARRGWGVGPRLGPGSLVGWEAVRQPELCDGLPLAEAGISLSGGGLLRPFKSASGLVPIGPGHSETTVGSICGLCALRDTCWRRR
jgi:hypothetical protein